MTDKHRNMNKQTLIQTPMGNDIHTRTQCIVLLSTNRYFYMQSVLKTCRKNTLLSTQSTNEPILIIQSRACQLKIRNTHSRNDTQTDRLSSKY